MTILFYCQYMIGLGHVTRSLALCRELLARGHQVDFVLGGPPVDLDVDHPGFRLVQLPPLQRSVETDRIIVPDVADPNRAVAERIEQRRQLLTQLIAHNRYDLVVIEQFPFSRWKLRSEILPMLEKQREKVPTSKVLCSVRDVLKIHDDHRTRDIKTAEVIRRYFDCVCVHSDPNLFTLDDTFSQAAIISDRLIYTGYAVKHEPADEPDGGEASPPTIVVSVGSGATNTAALLLKSVAAAARKLSEFQIAIAFGHRADGALVRALRESLHGLDHVTFQEFIPDFYARLAHTTLSIGLGGATVIEALSLHTRQLVFTSPEIEDQMFRCTRFAERGLLRLLSEEEVSDPKRFATLIRNEVKKPRPAIGIKASGITVFANVVDELLAGKPPGTQWLVNHNSKASSS